MKTIDPETLAQPVLHRYLLTAVAPRPICFASTVDEEGQVNLSPFSFFNVFSSNPPILVFSPARSGRDNTTKHTYDNVKMIPEVVINIVNHPMVEQMSLASTAYPKGVNEFVKAGFTQVASEKVRPPRVGEAPVALECTVDQVIELGDQGGAGNLVIARVVLMHVQTAYLDEEGMLDTQKLDLVARMGGSWYCRASGDALFEVPKPTRNRGIGVDQLPAGIRDSKVLTGNNLGRLGNIAQLPTMEEILAINLDTEVQQLLSQYKADESLEDCFHQTAQAWLEAGDSLKALKLLLYFETLNA